MSDPFGCFMVPAVMLGVLIFMLGYFQKEEMDIALLMKNASTFSLDKKP